MDAIMEGTDPIIESINEQRDSRILVVRRHDQNFTVMHNDVLHDDTLSMKAKGLHAYIMSLPKDWVLYLTELEKHFSDGYRAVRNAFVELEEAGYAKRERKFGGWNVTVYDMIISKPAATLAKTHSVQKGVLLNTDIKEIKKKALKPQTPAKTFYNKHLPCEYEASVPFMKAWKAFLTIRHQSRRPMTDFGVKRLIKKLKRHDLIVNIMALNKSADNGWSGVFPESIKEHELPTDYKKQMADDSVNAPIIKALNISRHGIHVAPQLIAEYQRFHGTLRDADSVKSRMHGIRGLAERYGEWLRMKNTPERVSAQYLIPPDGPVWIDFKKQLQSELGMNIYTGKPIRE